MRGGPVEAIHNSKGSDTRARGSGYRAVAIILRQDRSHDSHVTNILRNRRLADEEDSPHLQYDAHNTLVALSSRTLLNVPDSLVTSSSFNCE